MKRRLFLSTPLLLSACGGGEPDDDTIELAAAPRSAALAPPVKVVLYGDSTEADNILKPYGVVPAQETRDWLAAHGYRFEVVVDAIGGTTAQSLLTGTDRVHNGVPFSEFMPASGAQIISLRYGVNERRDGYTHEQYAAVLQRLVNIARANGVFVVINTPSPVSGVKASYVEGSAVAARGVFHANRDVAVLCDQFYYANLSGMTATLDGVHPTVLVNEFQERKLAHAIVRANMLRLGITP